MNDVVKGPGLLETVRNQSAKQETKFVSAISPSIDIILVNRLILWAISTTS